MSGSLDTGTLSTRPVDGVGESLHAFVRDLLGLFGKTVRAYQMYSVNNPVYERFVGRLRSGFEALWRHVPSLHLVVEEAGFRWEGELIAVGEGRDSVPFQFYKDGVRYITFLPGFEEELERLLDVIVRSRRLQTEEDDLVTLLWEQEFSAFQYGYVDVLADGVELPEGNDGPLAGGISLEVLADDIGSLEPSFEGGDSEPVVAAGTIRREDFFETLYFLDPDELDRLRQELDDEWARDMREEVLRALFDRLEDGSPARQTEILDILRQLLPVFLARGDLASAAMVLQELEEIMRRGDVLGAEQHERADALFDELSKPAVIGQLLQAIEDGAIAPDRETLALFLSWLRPAALPVLFRAAERSNSAVVRARVGPACDRLAAQHPDLVIALLESDDDAVAAGAARAAGRLRLPEAARGLIRLLTRRDAATRLVAVESLIALHDAQAMEGLQKALDDENREVRIAAARGLGALRYAPARKSLEKAIAGKALRDADLTEKLAFFKAYADLGGADAITLLDTLLNGRTGILGRRHSSELRACAATALGRIGTPAARACLERAGSDPDTIVRSAVARALRREGATS